MRYTVLATECVDRELELASHALSINQLEPSPPLIPMAMQTHYQCILGGDSPGVYLLR
jgi:hypothetical protein